MALKEHGYFWNSREKDRVYSADSFSEWAKTFFTTGVFVNTNHVRAASGLTITVDAGYCNVEGKVAIFDAADTLTIDTPHASLKRIDTVVIERNDVEREFYRKIVTGNPAANPVAKAPVRANGVYQLVLAQITVGAGVTSITQANIKDTRANANLCGYVAGVAKEISWEQITAQWDAYYEEFKASQFADFDDWFDHMKGQLTTDAAGNLQTQIDGIKNGELVNSFSEVEEWHGTVLYEIDKNRSRINSAVHGVVGRMTFSGNRWTFSAYLEDFGVSIGDYIWVRLWINDKSYLYEGRSKIAISVREMISQTGTFSGEIYDALMNIIELPEPISSGTDKEIQYIEKQLELKSYPVTSQGTDYWNVVDEAGDIEVGNGTIKRYGKVVSMYIPIKLLAREDATRTVAIATIAGSTDLKPAHYVASKLFDDADGVTNCPVLWIAPNGVIKVYAKTTCKFVATKQYYISVTYIAS